MTSLDNHHIKIMIYSSIHSVTQLRKPQVNLSMWYSIRSYMKPSVRKIARSPVRGPVESSEGSLMRSLLGSSK